MHLQSQPSHSVTERNDSTTITDWDGPGDADNPQNWSLAVKWFHTVLIAWFAVIATLGTSIITPGLSQIAHEFSTTYEVATVAFVTYIFGLALGAPVSGPLSEAFGRRYVYQVGMTLSGLFILGTGFANHIAALIILRFFAGLFASPSLSCAASVMADLWSPDQRSTPLAFVVVAPFLGPSLGPLLGGFTTTGPGWRWTSWTLLLFYAVSAPPAIWFRETYKKTILQRRARRLGVKGPSNTGADAATATDKSAPQTAQLFIRSTLSRSLHMLFTEPVVWSFCLFVAYNFALTYSFYTAFPYVFEVHYGFSLRSIGLTFLSLGLGATLGVLTHMQVNNRIYKPMVAAAAQTTSQNATSRVAPEHRLYSAMLGGPLITSAFFIFGWTAVYSVHWVVPLIAEGLFGAGSVLVFTSCTGYTMDTFGPLYGASAMAANSMLRYGLGGVFPLFALQMFEALGVQWACTLLGCVSAVGMMVPYVLFKFGPRMRAKSKYRIGT